MMEYIRICRCCQKEFKAFTCSTLYCSKACASKDYKRRKKVEKYLEVCQETEQERNDRLKSMNVLHPSQAAEYLGVSRVTLYRYLNAGIIPFARPMGRVLIRRDDLDSMFERKEIGGKPKKELRRPSFEDYMSHAEFMRAAGVSGKTAQKLLARTPYVTFGGARYYEKDRLMRIVERRTLPDLSSWYTKAEVMSRYGMTESAVYSFVRDNDIPRKRIKGTAYYSKAHFDALKEPGSSLSADFYSREEALDRYHLSINQLRRRIRKYGIPCRVVRGCLWIDRRRMDEVMNLPRL